MNLIGPTGFSVIFGMIPSIPVPLYKYIILLFFSQDDTGDFPNDSSFSLPGISSMFILFPKNFQIIGKSDKHPVISWNITKTPGGYEHE